MAGGIKMTVTNPSYPVSRKNHICDWCYETIEKGTKYATWFWFEEQSNTKVHLECENAIHQSDYEYELPSPGSHRRGCYCQEKPDVCCCEVKIWLK